jgi:hypothetical protein
MPSCKGPLDVIPYGDTFPNVLVRFLKTEKIDSAHLAQETSRVTSQERLIDVFIPTRGNDFDDDIPREWTGKWYDLWSAPSSTLGLETL